jgi:ELWxxDGT repeat protein
MESLRSGLGLESLEARMLLSALGMTKLGEASGRVVTAGDNIFILGDALWRTDGTVKGTKLVRDFEFLYGPAAELDGILYFRADDGIHGDELWRSDGRRKGTWLVEDIVPGPDGSYPWAMASFNGALYFHATTIPNGEGELWISRGTAQSTRRFMDLGYVDSLSVAGGKLFIKTGEWSLWMSDGTRAGTVAIAFESTNFAEVILPFAGSFFYTGPGYLIATDGTMDGTETIVNSISPAERLERTTGLIEAGEHLFFLNSSFDFNGTHQHSDLWISDGTRRGSRRLKTFGAGTILGATAKVGDTLFFTITDPTAELWKSDGTSKGTVLVRRFKGRRATLEIGEPVGAGRGLYFTIARFISGGSRAQQLWRSDGTAKGTRVMSLLDAGQPKPLRVIRGKLFTALGTIYAGRLPVPQITGGTAKDRNIRITGTNGADIIGIERSGDMLRISTGAEERLVSLANVLTLTISARGGDDMVWLESGVPAATINGGPGNDRIIGSDGDDILHGGGGDDTIKGGFGNDVIDGDGGDDLLFGRDGKCDVIVGDDGTDTVLAESNPPFWSDQLIEVEVRRVTQVKSDLLA